MGQKAQVKAKKDISIDGAKERLRSALSRLENVVEGKIEAARKQAKVPAPANNAEIAETKEKLEESKKETEHLREENRALHSQVGAAQEKTRALEKVNSKATERVDALIKDLKKIMVEKGL